MTPETRKPVIAYTDFERGEGKIDYLKFFGTGENKLDATVWRSVPAEYLSTEYGINSITFNFDFLTNIIYKEGYIGPKVIIKHFNSDVFNDKAIIKGDVVHMNLDLMINLYKIISRNYSLESLSIEEIITLAFKQKN